MKVWVGSHLLLKKPRKFLISSELEVGRQYEVSWKDDPTVALYIYKGALRGFHLFQDASGKVVPIRGSNLIVKEVCKTSKVNKKY